VLPTAHAAATRFTLPVGIGHDGGVSGRSPVGYLLVATGGISVLTSLALLGSGSFGLSLGVASLMVAAALFLRGPAWWLGSLGASFFLSFQSSDALSPIKLLPVAIIGVLVTVAWADGIPRPVLRPVAVGCVVLLASIVPATLTGTSPTSWVRDVVPYGLALLMPIAGLAITDRRRDQRGVGTVAVALCVVGVLSTAAYWFERRSGSGALPIPTLLQSTFFMLSVAHIVVWRAITSVNLDERRRRWWIAGLVLVLSLVLFTGTRSFLLAAPGLGVTAWMAGRVLRPSGSMRHARPARRSLRSVVIAVGLSVMALATIAPTAVSSRFTSLLDPSSLADDQSIIERRGQLTASWEGFVGAPLAGRGPGAVYTYRAYTGRQADPISVIDSPLGALADYGLGALVLIPAVIVAALAAFRHAAGGAQPPFVTGWLISLAALQLIISPIEDKGFALALVVLMCLASASRGTSPLPPQSASVAVSA
jgi:hypothetical protein